VPTPLLRSNFSGLTAEWRRRRAETHIIILNFVQRKFKHRPENTAKLQNSSFGRYLGGAMPVDYNHNGTGTD